ncbi:peptidoglycan transglycosylase [Caldimicrobium thiodismutans]|uniref:Biosynthetic peptidoglycan transglycosylase n=1 Tax=Caldimicrobium thiodismutans TaxID=1653476 RepID=A0A0U5AFU6_9BACT|nr:monofunctional biosynthetic peptidoglycan transglycosylase [Caldimicrobium thiodismutans]BAU22883.1 peptidoglycan transglycosylase [Caldimicrobium thiodismutans]
MKKFKIFLILLLILFLGYVFVYPWFIPLEYLKRENPGLTAMMKYRQKQWEREGKNIKLRQSWVPLKKISPYLIKAVLIAEDDKFYRHAGFDLDALEKALEKNLQAGKIKYGGSTISQQTAKNLFLSPSKNPIRKIQEAILTFRLERTLSKKRILEIYLNIAEWGQGIFGIEEASKFYYRKSASGLTPWESARLASVLPNPLKYNPLGNSPYVEKRSRLIYYIMKKRGIIKEEYQEIEKEAEKEAESDKVEQGSGVLQPAIPPSNSTEEGKTP